MSVMLRLVVVCSLLLLSMAAEISDSPTVYQVMESYGFPAGLLPKGIISYEIESSSGRFNINLNKTCTFSIEGYDLKYLTKVTGEISGNKIKNLAGIQVRIVFFWLNIVEVSKIGDDIDLSVGIASASFPADNFVDSPQCGCGFDCVNAKRSGRFIFKSLFMDNDGFNRALR